MSDDSLNSEIQVSKMGIAAKFLGVFTGQPAVFEYLRLKPDWLFPVLIMIMVTIIMILTTTDLQLSAQREFINNSEIISEERKIDMLDALENQGVIQRQVLPALGGVLSVFVYYAVIAAVFLFFGNFIYGGQSTFKHMFSLVSWGSLIGIVEGMVKIPLMISKQSLEIYTSPALFWASSESKTIFFQFLDTFDIFALWKIVIFSLGFSVIYKFNRGKAFAAVVILYLFYIIIKIGLGQLFQGFIS